MKRLSGILALTTILFLTACEEVPGPAGEDGVSFLGGVFELEGDFTNSNDYELYFDFPSSFEIYETDVVLVYILWEQATGSNDQTLDVWRALPQTRILSEGILQYNFDYTYEDVKIFLDGDINFDYLNLADTHNQIFRVVVFPADYAEEATNLDINNLSSVMSSLNIDANEVQKFNF